MAEQTPHDKFMEADAEFSVACRAYNEAADKLWAATRKRSAAWEALKQRAEQRSAS